MRLNLPNYDCVEFEIRGDFAVPADTESELRSVVEQTSHHEHDLVSSGVADGTVGIFGSKFVIDGISHRALGNLLVGQKDGEPWANVWLVNSTEGSLSRPPRNIKSVSLLLSAMAKTSKPMSARCSAIFEYDPSEGWTSKIAFPIPLILPGDLSGVTHIETAEFSRRDNDGVRFRVAVSQDDQRNMLIHTVHFDADVDWSIGSFRKSLNYARTISRQLIVQEGDARDGTTRTGDL